MEQDFDFLFEGKEKLLFNHLYKKIYHGRIYKATDRLYALQKYIKQYTFEITFPVNINSHYKDFIEFFEDKRKLGISISKTLKIILRTRKNEMRNYNAISYDVINENSPNKEIQEISEISKTETFANTDNNKSWDKDFSSLSDEVLISEYASWSAKRNFLNFLIRESEKLSKSDAPTVKQIENAMTSVHEEKLDGNAALENKDKHFTIDQLAEFLRCSKVSIHKYKKQGLPYYKIGRKILFKESEVLDFMKGNSKGRKRTVR